MTIDTPERITIGEEVRKEAHEANQADFRNSTLILCLADGSEKVFPPHLQETLLDTLKSLANTGGVFIGKMPEELTSTVAADTLGVSRPTLMKWVEDGKIGFHKVGSHTRFKREDVLGLKAQRSSERQKAFDELRALDDEMGIEE